MQKQDKGESGSFDIAACLMYNKIEQMYDLFGPKTIQAYEKFRKCIFYLK